MLLKIILQECIYNSRNYNGVLNRRSQQQKSWIYNSRNYNGVLNMLAILSA